MKNQIDAKKIKAQLSDDDIINLLDIIGIPLVSNKNSEMIFYTGDHNEDAEDGSSKLYYYKETRIFHCYTCGNSYDIISLIEARWQLIGKTDFTFFDILSFILDNSDLEIESVQRVRPKKHNEFNIGKLLKRYSKSESIETDIELPQYDNSIARVFCGIYPLEWIEEGISIQTMDKYKIGLYPLKNAITIPTYFEGMLAGIRARYFGDEADFGKYRPLQLLDGSIFKFPTSYVFYGWDENIEAIKRSKKVILVEGEKSVLKSDTWYGDNSITLGMFGKTLGKLRLKMLLSLGIEEIIIGIDSDYHIDKSEEFEFYRNNVNKIADICRGYCKISVIYNTEYDDAYKFSPFDFTKEQFEKMFINREVL